MKFVRFLWSNIPLGSVEMPLTVNESNFFSTPGIRCCGLSLFIMFLMVTYVHLKKYGTVTQIW